MKLTLFSDPGKPSLPRNRVVVLLLGWALLVPAFCYAVLGDAPLYAVMAVVGLVLSVLSPVSFRVNARTHIYSIVIALVLAVFTNLLYKVDVEHFFLPVETFFPFLLFLGVAYSFLDQRPIIITIALAGAVTGLLSQGSSLSPPNLVRFPFDSPILRERFTIFSLCVIAQSYSILQLPKYAVLAKADKRHEGVRSQILRVGITAASTLLLFGLTVGAAYSSRILYNRLDAVFSPIYRQRFEKRKAFASTITLNSTSSMKRMNEAALFVDSPQAPGYLRGRVYHKYDRGQWFSAPINDTLKLERGTGSLASSTYDRGPLPRNDLVTMDILPEPRFDPEVLYLPGNVQAVELIAARLSRNEDDMFAPGGWDSPTGCRIFCPKIDQTAAPATPMNPGAEYLQLPVPIDATIYALSESIVQGASTDWEKVKRIVNHLQNQYSYSLDPTPPSDKDPVLAFLEDTKKGHCELFATSAVLLLRAQKIKARYVTGFIAFESGATGGYVARYRDCHAWAEVWLKDRGWVMIEPTPASGVPTGVRASIFRRIGDRLQSWILWTLAMAKRGYFAEAIIGFAKGIWRLITWLLVRGPWFISWPILLGLIAYTIHRRRRNAAREHQSRAPEYEEIRKLLLRIIAGLKIDYAPSMSLREVAAAAQENGSDSDGRLKRLLLEYEQLRYSPDVNRNAAADFLKRVQKWSPTSDNGKRKQAGD